MTQYSYVLSSNLFDLVCVCVCALNLTVLWRRC